MLSPALVSPPSTPSLWRSVVSDSVTSTLFVLVTLDPTGSGTAGLEPAAAVFVLNTFQSSTSAHTEAVFVRVSG